MALMVGFSLLIRVLLYVICFHIIAWGAGAGLAWKGGYGVISAFNEATRYPLLEDCFNGK